MPENTSWEIERDVQYRNSLKEEKSVLDGEISRAKAELNAINFQMQERNVLLKEIPILLSQKNELIKENSKITDSILSKEEIDERELYRNEIASLRLEKQTIIDTNLYLAQSNTDIQKSIDTIQGRINELDKKEEEYNDIMSNEIAQSFVDKTRLETQKEGLRKEITALTETKNVLAETITLLKSTFDGVLDRINGLDITIGNAVKVNNDNVREIELLLVKAGGELKKIIDVNTENVSKTNVVIHDLPRIIFELQRDIFERKNKNKIII